MYIQGQWAGTYGPMTVRPCGSPRSPSPRRVRRPARAAEHRQDLGEPPGALLDGADGRGRERRRGLGREQRRPPPPRRAALPRLARVPGERRLPRAARARHARRAARQERRLRARDAGRPRHRVGVRGAVGGRVRPARLRAGSCASRRFALAAVAVALRRLGRRLAGRAAAARRTARAGAARRLAAVPRRRRARVLLARGRRLPPALPAAERPLRDRGHGRVRAARRGDDRHRVGAQLARVVVGVAPADARLVPPHRGDGAHRVARGALQRALPRPDARRRARRQRAARRPERLHVVLGAARSARTSRRC